MPPRKRPKARMARRPTARLTRNQEDMSAENNNAATNIDSDMGHHAAHGGDGPDGTADQVHHTNNLGMPTPATRQAPLSQHIQYPPGPNFDTDPASILPPFRAGLREEPPGAWATWISNIPYPVARSDNSILFEEIEWLLTLNNRRELVVKPSLLESKSKPMTSNTLNLQIGSSRMRVQSALVQMKGVNVKCLCEQCRRGLGPWPGCKVVQHPTKLISACSNCLWRGKAEKCMYYQPPPGEEARGRDSIWVSQSTIDDLKNWFDCFRRCFRAERRTIRIFTRRGLLVPPHLRERLPSAFPDWPESFEILDELLRKPLHPRDDEDVADADGDEDDDVELTDADNDDDLLA